MGPQSKSQLAILIVEDEQDALATLSMMVKMKFPELKIYLAENGKIGVEIFKKYLPEIVLTDVNMPVKNGIEMAAEIKEIKKDTKFIVLTAYNEKIFFQKFKAIGFSSYLLKPLEFKKLFVEINKCIAEIMSTA
ncbi:MAG TPA: response regulator [Desulfuromonadaceae bacterium]|jgi:hypothetical protein